MKRKTKKIFKKLEKSKNTDQKGEVSDNKLQDRTSTENNFLWNTQKLAFVDHKDLIHICLND